jgi:plasmid rolling circle replication initiator protein Rep
LILLQSLIRQAFKPLDKDKPPDVGLFLPQKQIIQSGGLMLIGNHHSLNVPVGKESSRKKTFLAEVSPNDQKWDSFRQSADKYADYYEGTKYSSYADRIRDCAKSLSMALKTDPETGEAKFKLEAARFCRVPRCPVCGWRHSMKWRAKAFKVMPRILEQYPDTKFLLLTLTVRTCPLDELRQTLTDMNNAWKLLTQRKQFPAFGWFKGVEFTRSSNDYAHPHFHITLMVKPSYFTGKNYLSQEKWVELWQKSLRADYAPRLDIRAVKDLKTGEPSALRAVLETLKYSVKSADILGLNTDVNYSMSNQDWLIKLTEQTHKMRMVATGGVMKEYLKDLEQDDDDLIHINENLLDDENVAKSATLMFYWHQQIKRYVSS